MVELLVNDKGFLYGLPIPIKNGQNRGVAQLVAHGIWDAGVAGSSPVTPTIKESNSTMKLQAISLVDKALDFTSRRWFESNIILVKMTPIILKCII